MIEFLFIALFQAVSGSPEAGQPPPSPEQGQQQAAPAEQQAGEEEERLICRREPVIGSRFTRRVCLSKDERDMLEREARGLLDDAMHIDSQSN